MNNGMDEVLVRLCQQFPDVRRDVISSLLDDCSRIVLEVAGTPLTDKTEELTRLRLEIRTRHPAYDAEND